MDELLTVTILAREICMGPNSSLAGRTKDSRAKLMMLATAKHASAMC